MGCVVEKKVTKQINHRVPVGIVDEFYASTAALGFIKERALAAAMHMFLQANKNDKWEAYRDVYSIYYEGQTSEAAEIDSRLNASKEQKRARKAH